MQGPIESPSRPTSGVRVDVRGVERVFPETGPVIERLDLRIAAGEFVSFLGPSGCGKSTLLRLIADLDRPDRGEIEVEERGAGARGFVFQEAQLLPWRTVLDNAALPLELMRVPKLERLARAHVALEKVGLADALSKYPNQLSGGMKMRVSVARALVARPRLLLLDEPFAALDELTRHRLQEDLRALWEQTGLTVIFVTHSVSEAVFLSERVILFTRRPARIALERKIELSAPRGPETRSQPAFTAAVDAISRAFRAGEGIA